MVEIVPGLFGFYDELPPGVVPESPDVEKGTTALYLFVDLVLDGARIILADPLSAHVKLAGEAFWLPLRSAAEEQVNET